MGPTLDVGRPDPPAGFYRNGFHTKAVEAALRAFAPRVNRPVICYPGSATDLSLADVARSRVIHVDSSFSTEQLQAMASLNLKAVATDAHTWSPELQDLSGGAVDVVAFFNPTGLDPRQVLNRVPTHDGSLVIYLSWDGVPRQLEPAELATNFPELVFAGAIRTKGGDEGPVVVDRTPYVELFAPCQWEALTNEERQYLDRRIGEFADDLSFPEETRPADRARALYEALCADPDGDLSQDLSYRPPRVGDGAVLVYRVTTSQSPDH
jgi:hypothetical protein